MATVTKDFRVKSGLVVEGANGTINGSDIITGDKISDGNQIGISVQYNELTGNVDFEVQASEAVTEIAQDAVANAIANGTQNGISVTYDDTANAISFNVNDPTITISGDVDGSAQMVDLANVEIAVTLDTVNANVGTFGSGTTIPNITVDGKGRITAVGVSDVATNLSIAGDTGTDTVSLLNDTLTVSGGEAVDVSVTNNTITVSAELATSTNLGVASFEANNFTVTGGAVESNPITLGNTAVNLGETVTDISGLSSVESDAITVTTGYVDNLIVADGFGANLVSAYFLVDLNMADNHITNLADPVNGSDAATKAYVDATAEGLHIKPAVLAATTEPLTATYNNGTNGVDATLTIAATPTLDIDGQTTWSVGDGVLVKDQTNAFENGRYFVVTVGDAETDWVLKRCMACDEADEIPSSYVFVQSGSTYSATGWVALVENPTTFTVGTDDITWTQFSGAGTYVAGSGLNLSGNEFSVETDPNESDALVTHTQLDGFLNSTDGTTYVALTEYTDLAIETGDPTATPTYFAIDYNAVATQVAATVTSTGSGQDTAYSFAKADFRSAKLLVKVAYGSHTQISEILLTLDTSDNIAITEYALVGTNGSLGDVSATVFGDDVLITVSGASTGAEIVVAGTLLV